METTSESLNWATLDFNAIGDQFAYKIPDVGLERILRMAVNANIAVLNVLRKTKSPNATLNDLIIAETSCRKAIYDLLYPYFIMSNNNDLDVFKEHLIDIANLIKKILSDTHALAISKIDRDKDLLEKGYVVGRDLFILKEYAGY